MITSLLKDGFYFSSLCAKFQVDFFSKKVGTLTSYPCQSDAQEYCQPCRSTHRYEERSCDTRSPRQREQNDKLQATCQLLSLIYLIGKKIVGRNFSHTPIKTIENKGFEILSRSKF